MKNPYSKAESKPHYLDRAAARIDCFDLFNIVAASQSHAGDVEAAEAEGEGLELSSVFQLHHGLAEPQLSQRLLRLAVFVRTFDDVMSDSEAAEAYEQHAAETSGRDYVAEVDGRGMDLREACNKIIHAQDVRPIYDRAGSDPVVWYMTGEIELEGTRGSSRWQAVLHLQQFIEVVLDRLAFGE